MGCSLLLAVMLQTHTEDEAQPERQLSRGSQLLSLRTLREISFLLHCLDQTLLDEEAIVFKRKGQVFLRGEFLSGYTLKLAHKTQSYGCCGLKAFNKQPQLVFWGLSSWKVAKVSSAL